MRVTNRISSHSYVVLGAMYQQSSWNRGPNRAPATQQYSLGLVHVRWLLFEALLQHQASTSIHTRHLVSR